jgi:hypothetical protein
MAQHGHVLHTYISAVDCLENRVLVASDGAVHYRSTNFSSTKPVLEQAIELYHARQAQCIEAKVTEDYVDSLRCRARLEGPDAVLARQWYSVQACYDTLVLPEEELMGTRYDWILRLRTDMVAFAPIPLSVPAAELPSAEFVYVPLGGFNPSQIFRCMSDHAFFCPRALCRPYFHLLELWGDGCSTPTRAVPGEKVLGNIFAHRLEDVAGSNNSRLAPNARIQRPFALSPRPRFTTIQWYFFARYVKAPGHPCHGGQPTETCCGLIRELKWPFVLWQSRCDSLWYLERACHERLVTLNRDALQNGANSSMLATCKEMARSWQRETHSPCYREYHAPSHPVSGRSWS